MKFIDFKNLKQDRYKTNIIYNYVFRGLGLILGLVSVNINLNYLGTSLYGLWITIASVVSWMSSGDLGISNGLRNALARAYGEGDTEKQHKLVSTAVVTLSKLALILFPIILAIFEILFATNIITTKVRIPVYITSLFFCLNLVLGISQSIAQSFQESWLGTMGSCLGQALSICFVILLTTFDFPSDLILFSIAHGISILIPNVVLILLLRKYGFYNIPILEIHKDFSKSLRGTILNVGMQFFCLQLCAVVLNTTDNVIINYLFGSELVTKYEIINKVYTTGTSLFSILLIALWSAVTFHMARKEYQWIEKNIRMLLGLWIVFSIGVVFVTINFNLLVKLWLGSDAVTYEPELVWLFGIYCIVNAFSSIFVYVINGIGEVKLQLVLGIVGAVLNIPLSIIFATKCGMGLFGVKFATFISVVICAIAMPIQVAYILQREKKKIK